MQPRYLKISRYHLGIITIYVLLIPLFWLLRGELRYSPTGNYPETAAIAISAFIIFLAVLFWRKGVPDIKPSQVFLATLYGTVFAVPEEIIFRGIVQGFLEIHLVGGVLPVLLSSLVFGAAHLPNGATSFHPRDWNWKFAGLTFLAGLPLGSTFVLTNSLLVPTLLHAVFVLCLQLFSNNRLDAAKPA